MPPLPSDAGSDSEDEIEPRPLATKVDDPIEEVDEEEDEDEEGDEDEYQVEKILTHGFSDDGIAIYKIKWLGYNKKADQTWEPESNLTSAQELLEEYFEKVGGRPTWDHTTGKPTPLAKGRKRASTAADSPAPGRRRKKARSNADTPEVEGAKKVSTSLPTGSWESQISLIDTIEEQSDEKDPSKTKRVVYVVWNNGNKTAHRLQVVNQKAPQKMLAYYEQHLVFKTNTAPVKTTEIEDEEMNGAA